MIGAERGVDEKAGNDIIRRPRPPYHLVDEEGRARCSGRKLERFDMEWNGWDMAKYQCAKCEEIRLADAGEDTSA